MSDQALVGQNDNNSDESQTSATSDENPTKANAQRRRQNNTKLGAEGSADTETIEPMPDSQNSMTDQTIENSKSKLRTPVRLAPIDLLANAGQSIDIPSSILGTNGGAGLPPAAAGSDQNQPSQLSAHVLVQQDKSFRSIGREEQLRRAAEERKLRGAQQKSDIQVSDYEGLVVKGTMTPGLYFQSVFHAFAVVLQGALAGFALCECASIWMFTFGDPADDQNNVFFMRIVGKYVLPLHAVDYTLLTLVTVAVCDRYDIGDSFIRAALRALRFQSGGLSIVTNLLALILSLVCIQVHHRIQLFTLDENEYLEIPQATAPDYEDTGNKDYYNQMEIQKFATGPVPVKPILQSDVWFLRYVLVARAACLLVSWLIIALRPKTDCLHKHMSNTLKGLTINTQHEQSQLDQS